MPSVDQEYFQICKLVDWALKTTISHFLEDVSTVKLDLSISFYHFIFHYKYLHLFYFFSEVPILHVIPVPFPDEWHTAQDNANVVDYPTVEKLNKILRVFVSEYLELA